jgi:hypothetical protein
VGIGFRETSAGSGVALEAFQMVVPPVYPGSSQLSRVMVTPVTIPPSTYGVRDTATNPNGNFGPGDEDKVRFESYTGAPLYYVHTQLAVDVGGSRLDSLPPNMFQVGDIIEADGNRFVIVDDARNVTIQQFPYGPWYLNPAEHPQDMKDTLICVRLDDVQQGTKAPQLSVPPNGYSYGIHRQPMGAERTNGSPNERVLTSGEAPLQLPAAISIDLMASGLEAGEMGTIFEFPRSYDTSKTPAVALPYVVGILFSPNGGIDSFWINGQRYLEASRVFFLLGRIENGNPDPNLYMQWDTQNGPTSDRTMSDSDLADRRSKINWINPDSRWLIVNGNDGRISVSQNALVDPSKRDFQTEMQEFIDLSMSRLSSDDIQARGGNQEARRQFARVFQIEAAHELAHGGHGDE